MTDNLERLLREAAERVARMTPAEREAMHEDQRRSRLRAFGPESACEHGELDFEQCPKCRGAAS